MASRSRKRMFSGSGKVLVQNSADIFRKCTASGSRSRSGKVLVQNSTDIFRKCTASGSGKVSVQNSADIFRKCTARSKFRKEEEEEEEEEEGQKSAGLHLVVSVHSYKHGHRTRLYRISCYDNEKRRWSRQINHLRYPFPSMSYCLLGSCNGLLAFQFFESKTRYLKGIRAEWAVWEPSTNKLQVTPQPICMTLPCSYQSPVHVCNRDLAFRGGGLYFDSHSGDYKLVIFVTNFFISRDDAFPIPAHHFSEHAEVYSVKNNAWKELTYPVSDEDCQIQGGGKGICVDGVCYWRAHCSIDCSYILSYKFLSEEFTSFHGPRRVERDPYLLVEFEGSLGVLIYPVISSDRAKYDQNGVLSLMVHSPLSSPPWSRVDSFDVPVVGFHEPLWFGKRNDSYYLLLEGPHTELLEYDYSRKVFNNIRKMPNTRDYYTTIFASHQTKTKNNASIWHSSSFHEVEVQKRFAVYANDQGGDIIS